MSTHNTTPTKAQAKKLLLDYLSAFLLEAGEESEVYLASVAATDRDDITIADLIAKATGLVYFDGGYRRPEVR